MQKNYNKTQNNYEEMQQDYKETQNDHKDSKDYKETLNNHTENNQPFYMSPNINFVKAKLKSNHPNHHLSVSALTASFLPEEHLSHSSSFNNESIQLHQQSYAHSPDSL